jgi:hypothetical protein
MVNELTCTNCSTMMPANQRYGFDIDFRRLLKIYGKIERK